MIFVFLSFHVLGSHYTYSVVPYDAFCERWLGFSLDAALGFERNMYDRWVHFAYGLLLAYPIREVFLRIVDVRGFWGYFLPLDLTMSTSMIYELIEWGAAVVFGGDARHGLSRHAGRRLGCAQGHGAREPRRHLHDGGDARDQPRTRTRRRGRVGGELPRRASRAARRGGDRARAGAARLVNAALRGHAGALVVLALAIAALYGRVLGYDFVQYDDHELLVLHYGDLVETGNIASVFWRDAFAVLGPEARGVFYRPLLVADYALEARIAGPSPAFFHATNLALHAIASGFAYALFVAFGAAIPLATGLALIFACHPASALVAAWIPCRNESMLAIACLASALALLSFLRSGRRAALALCIAGYAAALFAKESGVVLLAVLAVIAAFERTGRAGEARALVRARDAALAVTLVWAALRHVALGRSPTGVTRALANGWELPVYLGKALFPVGLAPIPDPADTPLWPGVAAIAVLSLAIFAARSRLRGPAGLGLVFCAAFLVPSLSVPAQTWGLEHRLYLPLVGLLLFASAFALPARLRAPSWLGTALAFAAALGFAVVTARRLPDFAGPIPYWESAARHAPHSAFAASRVAWRYYQAGRFAEVPEAATRALALDPQSGEMYLARGIAYAKRGDLARAEPDLRRAVELEPDNADAWSNLARLQRLLGQSAQSDESQRRAGELGARPGD